MAINMGGDDFIQKPFDLDVLVAKISALLRRNYTYQNGHNLKLSHRDLSFHVTNSTIQFEEQSIELSRNEFIILQLMMRRIGKIVPREDLMQALWNDEQFVDDNTLTVNVNRLRRKITGIGLEDFIVTRKGMGYLKIREALYRFIRFYLLHGFCRVLHGPQYDMELEHFSICGGINPFRIDYFLFVSVSAKFTCNPGKG